jgi:hypothetical protein
MRRVIGIDVRRTCFLGRRQTSDILHAPVAVMYKPAVQDPGAVRKAPAQEPRARNRREQCATAAGRRSTVAKSQIPGAENRIRCGSRISHVTHVAIWQGFVVAVVMT